MKQNKNKVKREAWYSRRYITAVAGILLSVVAYPVGLHALDTGSWQQYGLTALCIGLALNRMWLTLRPNRRGSHDSSD